MKIGYARVSSKRQRLDLQCRALTDAGCDVIVAEATSSTESERKGLIAAMAVAGEGDTLVVWKLDRLGRDIFELLDIVRTMQLRRISLQVLSGQASAIDISTREGQALYAIYAAIAGIEAESRNHRSRAGLQAAASRPALVGSRRRQMARRPRREEAPAPRKLKCAFNRTRPS